MFQRRTPPWPMLKLLQCCMVTLLLLSYQPRITTAKVVGALVLPHGGIALDPSHFQTNDTEALALANQLHHSCLQAARDAAALAPDLIFLVTPHGIAASQEFLLYHNPTASGFADTDNCACPPCCYNISVHTDTDTVAVLARVLRRHEVRTLSAFGPPGGSSEAMPLRWGEVIPLHFLEAAGLNLRLDQQPLQASAAHSGRPIREAAGEAQGGRGVVRVVVLSLPSRRYTDSVAMIPELITLGSHLFGVLEAMTQRVLVVVSADLAHTHMASGPYGFSKSAHKFDAAVERWAERGADREELLGAAARYVDKAKSCGFTGLVLLQGMLDPVVAASQQLTPASHLLDPTPLELHYSMRVETGGRQPIQAARLEAESLLNGERASSWQSGSGKTGSGKSRGGAEVVEDGAVRTVGAVCGKVYASGHPSYYGMMVASFAWQSDH